jgi:hypothetical protein
MPEFGQQITQGIKYIKVSKTDKEGNDRGQSLLTANTLRINYPDVGPQNYLINTAQNFADYVLLGVVHNNITSSENRLPNYQLTASVSNVQGPTGATVIAVNNYSNVAIDARQYFSAETGKYTFDLPNFLESTGYPVITMTISDCVDAGNTVHRVYKNRTTGGVSGVSIGAITGNGTRIIPLTGSNFITSSGDQFGIFVSNLFGSASANVSFSIDPNYTPTTNNLLTTIEPSYDFQFSDYNILNGNIDIPRTSRQFMDVDYSTGVLTPTNITPIISGTATPATVQDSNYTLQRHANPRYGGSKQSSPDFNTIVIQQTNNPTQPNSTIYQAPGGDADAGK